MKKSILFSAIIGALLFMTSCLGEVSRSYTDPFIYVYIDIDNSDIVYGKPIIGVNGMPPNAPLITANGMQKMNPGTIKIMSYSWDEENGTKPITISGQMYQADYVNLIDETIDVDKTSLIIMELPEVAEPLSFLEFASPILFTSEFIGDNFLFQYSYEVLKGQTSAVQFYKREQTVVDSNDIIIDVHLTHTGAPTGTTVEKKLDFIALDMRMLRSQYANSNHEELKIKFVYHLKDRTEPIESPTYSMLLKEN